jgi:hypothetical protein
LYYIIGGQTIEEFEGGNEMTKSIEIYNHTHGGTKWENLREGYQSKFGAVDIGAGSRSRRTLHRNRRA